MSERGTGKLAQLDRSATEWFAHFVPRSVLPLLPIAASRLGAVEDLQRLHGDRFDRLLAAQARHAGLTMVTVNSYLTPYDVDVFW